MIVVPAVIAGHDQRAFCAALPAWCRCGLAMSVWTSTVMMKPPKVDCDSASAKTRLVSASASPPPCSLAYIRPSRPASPSLRSTSRGVHAGLFPRERVRLDLARDEARDLLAQQLVLGGEVDAFHAASCAQEKSVASLQPSARMSVDAQVRLARHQELVELRRRDGGAGEHRVRLAAVMHLVGEQVGDDVAAPLALDRGRRRDRARRRRRAPAAEQAVDVGDEALVGRRLRRRQVGRRDARFGASRHCRSMSASPCSAAR